jgi:hypothetical protein
MLLILKLGFLRFGFGVAHLRRGKNKTRGFLRLNSEMASCLPPCSWFVPRRPRNKAVVDVESLAGTG